LRQWAQALTGDPDQPVQAVATSGENQSGGRDAKLMTAGLCPGDSVGAEEEREAREHITQPRFAQPAQAIDAPRPGGGGFLA
jgi:hypothetical protein